jgi:hypothetical protein
VPRFGGSPEVRRKELEGEIRYSAARPENGLPDRVSKSQFEEPTVRVGTCAARRMGLA